MSCLHTSVCMSFRRAQPKKTAKKVLKLIKKKIGFSKLTRRPILSSDMSIVTKPNKKYLPYLLLLPAVGFILVFLFYPFGNVFVTSLHQEHLSKPWMDGFIGFEHFERAFFDDRVFYGSLWVTLRWIVGTVGFQLVFGLIAALILNRRFRGRGIARTVVIAPWAISGVLVAIMWGMLFHQQAGAINDILLRIGLLQRPIAWASRASTALPAAILAETWRGIPFFAIILLASLQSIPDELHEVCQIDGGGPWTRFRYVIFPFLKDTIILGTLLRTAWEFKHVDVLINLTGGGPANRTTTLAMYSVRQAISTLNFGYGSALAVVGFVILAIFAGVYLQLSRFGQGDV